MIGKHQIKTRHNLQVKCHQLLAKLKPKFSLPEYKHIHDMILGMLKSQTVIINQIAQALGESINLKKTCERLYRNLRKEDLGERLQRIIPKEQSTGLNSETAIIVDDSDIIKSKALKMEGLNKVRAGSTGAVNQNGYDLVNIIACQSRQKVIRSSPSVLPWSHVRSRQTA